MDPTTSVRDGQMRLQERRATSGQGIMRELFMAYKVHLHANVLVVDGVDDGLGHSGWGRVWEIRIGEKKGSPVVATCL